MTILEIDPPSARSSQIPATTHDSSAALARVPRVIRARLLLAVCLCVAALPPRALADDLVAHAARPQITPTYDGSGQVVEPDVLYLPSGWQGYEYWMTVTPYPCGDESAENPSILASHDGASWETPTVAGFTAPAPLVANHEPCSHYMYCNNDPSLVLVGDTLAIYYFVTWYDGPKFGTTELRRIASTDGVHWTSGDSAAVLWSNPNYVLSPTVVHDGRGWRMWYVKMSYCGSHAAQARVRTSVDGLVWPDSTDRPVTIDGGHGLPFHLTVKRVQGVYAMLYVAYPSTGDCGQANTLFYAESSDGEAWHSFDAPLLSPSFRAGDWDGRTIYRSSFAGRYPNIGIWYSAFGDSVCVACDGRRRGPVWHMGFTSLGDYHTVPVEKSTEVSQSRLLPVYPNPIVNEATVRFDLLQATRVRLDIYDLVGRHVAVLADGVFPRGHHSATWNLRQLAGSRVASGIYLASLRADGMARQTTRMIVTW